VKFLVEARPLIAKARPLIAKPGPETLEFLIAKTVDHDLISHPAQFRVNPLLCISIRLCFSAIFQGSLAAIFKGTEIVVHPLVDVWGYSRMGVYYRDLLIYREITIERRDLLIYTKKSPIVFDL